MVRCGGKLGAAYAENERRTNADFFQGKSKASRRNLLHDV